MKINVGEFKEKYYLKKVNLNKAVLWKTKELSLKKEIMDKIVKLNIPFIIFYDTIKRNKWLFKTKKVIKNMIYKSEGQESQYYFSIDLKENIK